MIEIDALIVEGRRVDAAATPGPWFVCVNDLIGGHNIQVVDLPASETPPGNYVADMLFRDEDGEAIAWMRNNLGVLLDELEALRRFRVDVQHEYQAIHARQQRDADLIAKLRAGEKA